MKKAHADSSSPPSLSSNNSKGRRSDLADHYDPALYQCTLCDLRTFERVNICCKVAASLCLFLFFIWLDSYRLTVAAILILVSCKLAWWLVLKGQLYLLTGWGKWERYSFKKRPFKVHKIGNYYLSAVQKWIGELSDELGILPPSDLIVFESPHPNAYAVCYRTYVPFMRNELRISQSLFSFLGEQELRAIICHELAHFSYKRHVSFFVQLFLPLITGKKSFLWCREYISDYAAADIIGPVPTANALLKLHHRSHVVNEIIKGLTFVQREFNIDVHGMRELQEILTRTLPSDYKQIGSIPTYFARTVETYFTERSKKTKGIGIEYAKKYERHCNIRKRDIVETYRTLDWITFDNRLRDGSLDDAELNTLYHALKADPKIYLFLPQASAHRLFSSFLSHPPLRERIIYIVEAVPPPTVTSVCSQTLVRATDGSPNTEHGLSARAQVFKIA